MKKLIAILVLGVSAAATVAVGAQEMNEPEPKVDLAVVDAKIDARLHAILEELIAARAQ
ncbi:MAG: hypothetical protein WBV82_30940 [Myxococcaceae bacterium]